LSHEDWSRIDSIRKELDSKIPKTKFLGFTVNAPIGVAAGPLLNHKFVNHYARLGFDMPEQKTVRSVATKVHPFPNVLLVNIDHQLQENEVGSRTVGRLDAEQKQLSITNSFGMPSKSIEEWQEDFKKVKPAEGQLKMISVVGTPSKPLPEDFAFLAQLGFEAGAQVVELNFSCPNVVGAEGMVYCYPTPAKEICKKVREQVGSGKKILAKLGHYNDRETMRGVLEGITEFVDGVCAINTIPLEIVDENGNQAMPGAGRLRSGVCGFAIKSMALHTVKSMVEEREKMGRDFAIVGVGGITIAQDALEFFGEGADAVQIATGAMWDQMLGLKIKLALSQRG
jgi:dihydroorotate dehydrogenase